MSVQHTSSTGEMAVRETGSYLFGVEKASLNNAVKHEDSFKILNTAERLRKCLISFYLNDFLVFKKLCWYYFYYVCLISDKYKVNGNFPRNLKTRGSSVMSTEKRSPTWPAAEPGSVTHSQTALHGAFPIVLQFYVEQ